MKKLLTLVLCFLFTSIISAQKQEITLDDLWKNYSFYPKTYSMLKSMKDGEHYSKIEKKDNGQEIIKYKYKNGIKVRTLFKSANFDIPRINSYTFSEDEKKILLRTESKKIYRYSSESIYYIYNIFTDKLNKISDDKLMYASFSPKGDKVAYVFENNLYIKNLKNEKITQVTKDGQKNYIINGASDIIAKIFDNKGEHTRAAVSVNSLPLGVAVEVDAIFELN